MTSIRDKRAMVIGGSSGIGRATVQALIAEGARVTAVARGAERLRALEAELGDGLETVQGDATEPELAGRLLRERRPELLVLAAGVTPPMARIDEFEWEAFSTAWNQDLRASFHVLGQALALPLPPGSTVVVVSSGAALNGSPLSGGYAGAKRMQWWLADYAQWVSDGRKLDLRFVAVLPEQLVEGTTIGTVASTTYAAVGGTTAEAYMKRWEVPLDAAKVAAAIVGVLRGEVADGVRAVGVKGGGIRTLP